MSYCRFGDESDVYVYPSFLGGIICCMCSLKSKSKDKSKGFDFKAETPKQMLAHLKKHIAVGNTVPSYALERLEGEIKALEPIVTSIKLEDMAIQTKGIVALLCSGILEAKTLKEAKQNAEAWIKANELDMSKMKTIKLKKGEPIPWDKL